MAERDTVWLARLWQPDLCLALRSWAAALRTRLPHPVAQNSPHRKTYGNTEKLRPVSNCQIPAEALYSVEQSKAVPGFPCLSSWPTDIMNILLMLYTKKVWSYFFFSELHLQKHLVYFTVDCLITIIMMKQRTRKVGNRSHLVVKFVV